MLWKPVVNRTFITDSWSNTSKSINTQKTGMVSLKQSDGKEVYIGLCCKPTLEIKKLIRLEDIQ